MLKEAAPFCTLARRAQLRRMVEHLDEKVAKQRSEIDRCAEWNLYQKVDNQVITQHKSQGGCFKQFFFSILIWGRFPEVFFKWDESIT